MPIQCSNWRLFHAYSRHEPNQTSEPPVNVFNAMALLSSTERNEIDEASKIVRAAHSSLHIARAVITNRDDLLDLIVKIGATFLDDPQAFSDGLNEPLAELSCKILNLCASFRSYLEHQETHLKKQIGRSSPAWIAWRSFLTQIERDNKYYALIYGLRNYIQHVDMPPLHLSLHSGRAEEVTLSVDLMAESLLIPTAQWSSEMRDFINSYGARISLWEALKGWDQAFRLILEKGTEFRIRPARSAAEFILNVRCRYNVPDYGMLGIALEPAPKDDGSITINISWVEERAAAALVELLGTDVNGLHTAALDG
ncbi:MULTISPECIES: hypothetical protein [Rhizobium]|uniref:hypothetical protein n=1 Tax=Rhizobium TaxID=379 RepID=UPI00103E269F|nr:hypothetical protein [Rhizobium leguminosarum]TCA01216.1 hypothetical protein E0H57_23460 [Rhizobium leguminosarum bv. viciae]UFW81014.1 hypothetical protein RlegSU303_27660 [Rhizobium leguminosarum bv. viciae]